MGRRLALLGALALAGCGGLFDSDLPALVTIRCGEAVGNGWAMDVAPDDGWGSYIVTSSDLVEPCIHGEPVDLDVGTILRNEIDLVRVESGSNVLVGHVWGTDSDGIAGIGVREDLEWLSEGSPPRVGDPVQLRRPGGRTGLGALTRADREGLAAERRPDWTDRGAALVDEDGDVIGTVVADDGILRIVPVSSLCRELFDC